MIDVQPPRDRALRLAWRCGERAAQLLSDDETGRWAISYDQARDVLAPFVRANRDAPPEALYIHARASRVHASTIPFTVLPIDQLLAWAIFVMVLITADAQIASDAAARAAAAEKPGTPRKPARDDHTMEGHDSLHDRVDLGRGAAYSDPRLAKKGKRK